MKLREFTNNLAMENGVRSYIHFETFVYKLLEKHLKDQSKKIFSYENQNMSDGSIDFLLPDGINDISGPIGVVVKFVRKNINSYFAAIRRQCEKMYDSPSIKCLLFILSADIPDEKKDELLIFARKATGLEVAIWDLVELSKIASNYTEFISEIVYNLEKELINSVVTKSLEGSPNQWKEKRNEYIKQLNEVYKKDDLVLFLGAGVSKDANISDWNVLVTDLLVAMISEKLNDNGVKLNINEQALIISQIKENIDSSPLLQARYIRTGLGKKFIEVVTKILYKSIDNGQKGTSDLLKSITRLCTPRRNSLGIKGVVTYNFDDLIEYHLKESNISYVPVYRESDTCSKEELPIYHVHGYLPRETNGYDESTENLLVFSEEGYHALMLDPYCWANITQLNFLRENTCLMFGLSLTDPNLRRLLDIAARKTHHPRHFAILKRQTINNKLHNKDIGLSAITSFITVDQELQEESFRELGLMILWVDDYKEIPGILDSIRK